MDIPVCSIEGCGNAAAWEYLGREPELHRLALCRDHWRELGSSDPMVAILYSPIARYAVVKQVERGKIPTVTDSEPA